MANSGKIVKSIVRIVSSMAVSVVVGNVVKMNTPEDINTLGKVMVFLGESIISSMVADQGADHVIGLIDEIGNDLKTVSK
jgi:hypothetical protein